MGVARTGPERREPSDDGAAPRPQTQRPARQRPSSHEGSYSFIRAGRDLPFQLSERLAPFLLLESGLTV
jgi:hypothetical protein